MHNCTFTFMKYKFNVFCFCALFRVGKKIRNSVNISRYVTVPHNSSHKKGYSHKR